MTNQTTPMKVVIYARVSTQEQSCDSQLHTLRKYAEARGLQIVAEYTDIISSRKERRPGLDEMMNLVRRHRLGAAAVLVFKFDRFARNTKELLMGLEEFQRSKVDFISYTENIDTTTPIGQAMFTMIGAMAQLERDLIKERVHAGLRAAKSRGTRLGRPITSRPEMIKALHAQGKTYRQIALELKTSAGSIARALRPSGPPKTAA